MSMRVVSNDDTGSLWKVTYDDVLDKMSKDELEDAINDPEVVTTLIRMSARIKAKNFLRRKTKESGFVVRSGKVAKDFMESRESMEKFLASLKVPSVRTGDSKLIKDTGTAGVKVASDMGVPKELTAGFFEFLSTHTNMTMEKAKIEYMKTQE